MTSAETDWTPDDFHPLDRCFFCKKREADDVDLEELYKVIRNTMGFPGYVVNYTTALIPIPICSQCSAVHREQGKQFRVLNVIAWAIATGVIYNWFRDSGDGVIVSLVLSAFIAIPASVVPLLVLCIIWAIFSKKTDEVAFKGDWPVVKKLLSMGWQKTMPQAKYGDRKNEAIDKEAMDRLNGEYQMEAREVITDFLRWCQEAALDGVALFTRWE